MAKALSSRRSSQDRDGEGKGGERITQLSNFWLKDLPALERSQIRAYVSIIQG
jgi:hypothetical protein